MNAENIESKGEITVKVIIDDSEIKNRSDLDSNSRFEIKATSVDRLSVVLKILVLES